MLFNDDGVQRDVKMLCGQNYQRDSSANISSVMRAMFRLLHTFCLKVGHFQAKGGTVKHFK